MKVWEIRPQDGRWRLSVQDETQGLAFDDLAAAERRGRWLAVRHEVKGWPAEIHILDADDGLVGAWRGERYIPAPRSPLSQAA